MAIVDPTRHPLLCRIVQGARWVGTDEFPSCVEWADEHEGWLRFIEQAGALDHYLPGLQGPKERRDEAFAEIAVAYFLSVKCGMSVFEWEPVGANGKRGEFLGDPRKPALESAPTEMAGAANGVWATARYLGSIGGAVLLGVLVGDILDFTEFRNMLYAVGAACCILLPLGTVSGSLAARSVFSPRRARRCPRGLEGSRGASFSTDLAVGRLAHQPRSPARPAKPRSNRRR